MKKRWIISIIGLILLLMLQGCDLMGGEEETPLPESETPTLEIPTDTATLEPPTPTATSTITITPSLTPTEEVSASLPVITSPVIYEFEMFTSLQGWAITRDGEKLLYTQDGGQTWLDATPAGLPPLPEGYTYYGITPFFLDENTAWFTANAVGGTLYHTTDGGLTWTSSAPPFERARYFFLDANIGYALVDLGAGAGSHYVAIHRTLDGGATWTEMFTHEPGEMKSLKESGSKGGITFLDVCHGWIGGTYPMTDYFYLHFTVDGAVTWALDSAISLPAVYAGGSWLDVWQPIFTSGTVGYLPVRALAPDDNFYLLIYRSDDSGQTWTFQSAVQDGESLDFYAIDEGVIVAGKELYQTIDGGASWSLVSGTGIPAGEYNLKVDFIDSQHGWVLATPDDDDWDPLKFYRTTDGGTTWTQLLP